MTNTTPDEYKVKVEKELSELLDKITNLTKFIYGKGILESNLSMRMKALLYTQLSEMTDYARLLQSRLAIWGKTDEELAKGTKIESESSKIPTCTPLHTSIGCTIEKESGRHLDK